VSSCWRKVLWLKHRSDKESELREELQFHLEEEADLRRGPGMTEHDARLAARRELGNVTLVAENTRAAWGWTAVDQLGQDLRYAFRTIAANRLFTMLAVSSLALGIGANTAIFSLLNTLALRELPVQDPGQIVEFLTLYPGDPPINHFSPASRAHFEAHNHVFSAIAGTGSGRFAVRAGSLEPETIEVGAASGNLFPMLGVGAAAGRLIAPGDDPAAVVVLSWSYWKRRFNLDPAALGTRIVVENVPRTVIGVMSRDFSGLQVGRRPQIWIPVPPSSPMQLIARLKPGVSIEQARAEMSTLFLFTLEERAKGSHDPQARQWKFAVEPASTGMFTELRGQFVKPLTALLAMVGLVLLLACLNVAGLLLARGAARQREMALRVSLGAGRLRLVRQVFTESLLLSAMGSLLGVIVAYFGAGTLIRIIQSGRPFVGMSRQLDLDIRPDFNVILFTAAAAILTALLFGAVPAWRAFTSTPALALRASGGAGETPFRRAFGKGLVVAQVALSAGLLGGAGLFISHLSGLRSQLGFQRDRILLMTLDPARAGYSNDQLSRTYESLLAELSSIPGVRSATVCAPVPLSGGAAPRIVHVDGSLERSEDRRYVMTSWVAPKYFETLGTPILAGRDFSFADRSRSRVAIVNQSTARHYFGTASPLGRSLTFDGDNRPYEIVGVAGDAKYQDIHEGSRRAIYLNTFQTSRPASAFALRTSVDPQSVAAAARQVMNTTAKGVPVVSVTTMAAHVDANLVPERLIVLLSSWFGALAALLAAIGLYGLLAYTVARRTGEIGVRMALGATQRSIFGMVVGEALWLIGSGLVLAVPLAYWGRRLAAGLIRDFQPGNYTATIFGAGIIIAAALFAAWLPALRASRVDPTEALRHE
jgi:predicted permease